MATGCQLFSYFDTCHSNKIYFIIPSHASMYTGRSASIFLGQLLKASIAVVDLCSDSTYEQADQSLA